MYTQINVGNYRESVYFIRVQSTVLIPLNAAEGTIYTMKCIVGIIKGPNSACVLLDPRYNPYL